MQEDSTVTLSERQQRELDVVRRVYEQQRSMYANRTHGCADRIVSLHQPYVRPIIHGKATAKTEFGAKLTVSLVDGYAEVTTLSWDAYNESRDLVKAAEAYKVRPLPSPYFGGQNIPYTTQSPLLQSPRHSSKRSASRSTAQGQNGLRRTVAPRARRIA